MGSSAGPVEQAGSKAKMQISSGVCVQALLFVIIVKSFSGFTAQVPGFYF